MNAARKILLVSVFAVASAFLGTALVGSYFAATVLVAVLICQIALVVILGSPAKME